MLATPIQLGIPRYPVFPYWRRKWMEWMTLWISLTQLLILYLVLWLEVHPVNLSAQTNRIQAVEHLLLQAESLRSNSHHSEHRISCLRFFRTDYTQRNGNGTQWPVVRQITWAKERARRKCSAFSLFLHFFSSVSLCLLPFLLLPISLLLISLALSQALHCLILRM